MSNYFPNYNEYYNNYLSHHGILGQKWGIRRYQNADGSLTNAGKKRYSDSYIKGVHKPYSWNESAEKLMSDGGNTETSGITKIKDALKDKKEVLNSLNKKADELNSDYKELENGCRYRAISGLVNSSIYDTKPKSMEDIATTMWFYACEDGDQGRINGYGIYLNEKNKMKEAIEIASQHSNAYDEYRRSARELTNELLGKYGNKPVYRRNSSYTVAKHMGDRISEENDSDGILALRQGVDGATEILSRKKEIAEANRIINKMGPAINTYKGMNHIPHAVEKTGLSKVNYQDMTDEQWKKLRDQLSSYK